MTAMGNVYSLVPVKNTRCVAYLWDGARPKWPSSEDYFMPQSFGNYLCSRWLQLLCTRCCPLNRQGPQINGKLARRKKGTTQTTSKTITHKKQNAALQPIYWRHEDMEKTSALACKISCTVDSCKSSVGKYLGSQVGQPMSAPPIV